MALPRWQDSGGRDFVFYHSHSGFEWDDVDTTNKYQDMLCHDFQARARSLLPPYACLHARPPHACMPAASPSPRTHPVSHACRAFAC